MVIEKGEKIHVVERRHFAEDIRRDFCGEVVAASELLVRAKGYVWVLNSATNEFVKKKGMRERVIYLGGRLTLNILPIDVDIQKVKYSFNAEEGHIVSDGVNFSLNFTEIGIIS